MPKYGLLSISGFGIILNLTLESSLLILILAPLQPNKETTVFLASNSLHYPTKKMN